MPHLVPVVIGSAAVLGLTVVGLSSPDGNEAPDESPVRVAASLGFTPENCAIAGLSAAESAAALGSLAAADALRDRLRAAEGNLDAAMTAYSEANTAVRRGLVSEEYKAARAHAEGVLAEAREEHETARELLSAVLSAGYAPEHAERFANCAASAAYSVPAEFRVMGFSDEAWEEIAGAVRQRNRIEAGVLDPEEADLSALTGLDDNAAVVAARERIAADLEDIERSFGGFEGES